MEYGCEETYRLVELNTTLRYAKPESGIREKCGLTETEDVEGFLRLFGVKDRDSKVVHYFVLFIEAQAVDWKILC